MGMRVMRLCAVVLLCVVGAVVCGGCASKAQPEYLDQGFISKNYDTIQVMPAVDCRSPKMQRQIHLDVPSLAEEMGKAVEDQGYRAVPMGMFAKAIPADQIAKMTPEDLAKLGPDDANILLFTFVDNTEDVNVGIGSNFRITGHCILVERRDGHVWWRQSGWGQFQQTGLIAAGMSQAVEAARAKQAFAKFIVSTLPERKS